MSNCDVEKIKEHRDLILLAEIGALIHDLGKLSKGFVESKSVENEAKNDNDPAKIKDQHKEILEREKNCLEKNYKILWEFMNKSINEIVNMKDKKDFEICIAKFIKEHGSSNESLIKLATSADRKDSSEDKFSAMAKQGKKLFKSTPFGFEEEVNFENFEDLRKSYYMSLGCFFNLFLTSIDREKSIEKLREDIFELSERIFINALGETRRAANDVTLWHHSYSTASFMKAFLIEYLIKNNNSNKFRILGIRWNAFEILLNVHRSSDIMGRKILIEELKEKIRDFLEVEFSIANRVYEDYDGMFFVFPNIDENSSIYQYANKEILRISNETTDGEIVPIIKLSEETSYIIKITKLIEDLTKEPYPYNLKGSNFEPKWIKKWDTKQNYEICQICGRRPTEEKSKPCDWCRNVRGKGLEERLRQKEGTFWIDEIADVYGNVALILGAFNITDWLNGDMLNTMMIRSLKDFNKENNFSKNYFKILKDIEKCMDFICIVKEIKNSLFELLPHTDEKYKELHRYNTEGNEKAIIKILNGDSSGKNTLIGPIKNEYNIDHNEANTKIDSLLNNLKSKINPLLTKYESSISTLEEEVFNTIKYYVTDFQVNKNEEDERNYLIVFQSWQERAKSIENSDLSETERIANILFRKTPSAARILRIWNVLEEFTSNSNPCLKEEKRIKFRIKGNNLKKDTYDVEIDKMKFNMYFDGSYFETTHRISYKKAGEKERGIEEFKLKIKKAEEIIVETDSGFKKFEIDKDSIKEENYHPFMKILSSPTQFMILVPADKSLEFLEKIRKNYDEKFSKVKGRLPFHIGDIFFKKKMPLYAILDSAKRMQNGFFNLKDWKLWSISKNSIKESCLKLKSDSGFRVLNEIKWEIGQKLGDGCCDSYHPYFIVESSKKNTDKRSTYFKTSCGKIVHILELQENDTISIHPSYFDFEFLDTSTRRFDIILKNGKRPHRIFREKGPRPYYLEEIDAFQELWNIFHGKKMTSSQINDFQTLLISKIEEWELKDLDKLKCNNNFVILVEDSIVKILEIKKENPDFETIKQSVLSGLFFDVLELYMNILKQKPEGDET